MQLTSRMFNFSCVPSGKVFTKSSFHGRSFSTLPLTEPLPNLPKQNEAPQTPHVVTSSKLSNGVRIITVASHSRPVTSVGVFLESGPRFEDPASFGVSFLLKHISFQKTTTRIPLRLVRDIEALGADYSVSVGREHLSYSSEVQSDKLKDIVPILSDVLRPQLEEYLFKDSIENAKHEAEAALSNPTVNLIERLHAEAFKNKGLGSPLYPSNYSLDQLDTKILSQYAANNSSAERVVVVAVGDVSHDEFVEKTSESFKNLSSHGTFAKTSSEYVGGDSRFVADSNSTHLAIGFSGASWTDKDFLALGVLQFLLGGGKALSRDGPGKGLASRFNRNIIEKSKGDIHEISTFNFNYSDTGLFGIYGVTNGGKGSQLVEQVVKEISSLQSGSVDAKDFARAKAQFKADLLFNNETKPSLLEFVGIHALAKDKVLVPNDYVKGIDSLTVEDVKSAAKRVFKSKPSISAIGNVWNVPTREHVQSALQ